jgi:A118 family predicted phage portal protein
MLPLNNTAWPPDAQTEAGKSRLNKYALHDAWYSGDPERLGKIYEHLLGDTSAFWGRKIANRQRRTVLHVPVAGDISGTSARFLFGEHPKIKIPGSEDEAQTKIVDTQKRLDDIIKLGAFYSRVSEAAQTASAIGGVYLKPAWDKEVADVPLLDVSQEDNAVPVFRYGVLTGVTFYKTVKDDGHEYYRLVESHEPGLILRGLYRGSSDNIGVLIPMETLPETAGTPTEVQTGLKTIAVRYVPNQRPNKLDRSSALGCSDYAGSETLMDSLDEVYTCWMRDIRLGKARLVGPESWMATDQTTGEKYFDEDQEVYMGLEIPGTTQTELTSAQFEIRAEQFEKTALSLYKQIVTNAGYSPQSFGLDVEGNAESGSALRIREGKSFSTTAKKADYWTGALEDILLMMLEIDAAVFKSGVEIIRPVVEMQDGVKTDINDIAPGISTLLTAGAMSAEVAVRTQHPDWSEQQVQDEVKRIREDKAVMMPNPEDTEMV